MDKIIKQTFLGYTYAMECVYRNEWSTGNVNYFVSRVFIKNYNGAVLCTSSYVKECPPILIPASSAKTEILTDIPPKTEMPKKT